MTDRAQRVILVGLVITLALSAVSAFLVFPAGVSAHANVARSEPPANAVLNDPPPQVVIWFTEPLEPALSQIQVLSSDSQRVDNDDSAVVEEDPSVMSVSLGDLPNGTYTVAWKNVSTVDGHRVRGSFIFSVGEPLGGAAVVETTGQGLFQSPSEPVIRWLVLLGGLAMVGGTAFHLLVLRPVLSSNGLPAGMADFRAGIEKLALRVVLSAGFVALAASLAHLVVQAAVVHDVSAMDAWGGPMKTILVDTDWGQTWLWRIGLLSAGLVATALALTLAGKGRWDPESWWTPNNYLLIGALLLGAGMLFTISWTSHGAATAGIESQSITSDFIHLLASSLWAGGILVFLPSLIFLNRRVGREDRTAVIAAMTPRFSAVAVISMGVLIITGIYGTWAQVTIIEAFGTTYGWSLAGKLGLVLLILVLGGVNLIWIRRRLETHQSAPLWLGRLIAVEAVVAVLIVLAVGFLTSLEPARQVASREGIGFSDGLEFKDTAEGLDIELTVSPGQVGANEFVVSLADRFGNPVDNADDVSIDITSLDVDLGKTTLIAENLGGGKYGIEEGLFSVSGAWQTALIVRRPDSFDARTAFRFITAKTTASGSALISPDPDKGQVFLGLELVGGAVLFIGVGLAVGGWRTRRGTPLFAPGAAAAVVGAVLLAGSVVGGGGGDGRTNPFPPNQASLAAGQELYVQNCLVCHGELGLGDGPGSEGLNPPPANLIIHVPLHPDPDLYETISDGIFGSAMNPFERVLSAEEIWHVINYIQTLE
ncbi:MAG TPA: hypothetical protein DCE26_08455 [Dehalococcoidia bacterium]|nr:hypothetical protein [Dehalococcoidia bacterium]